MSTIPAPIAPPVPSAPVQTTITLKQGVPQTLTITIGAVSISVTLMATEPTVLQYVALPSGNAIALPGGAGIELP